MKPFILLTCAAALAAATLSSVSCAAPAETKTEAKPEAKPENKENKTMHDFSALDIAGKEHKLSEYKGKTVLIVNTASRCGFTKQFDGLEKLYQANKDKDFVILGFPSNDFGAQDPGTNEEIIQFCKANYGVTFPMMSKIAVKGEAAHPLYQWLTSKESNPQFGGPIGWNFTKFLINKDGAVVARFDSKTEPMSDAVKEALARELK
jgi:glutathione peroxidase